MRGAETSGRPGRFAVAQGNECVQLSWINGVNTLHMFVAYCCALLLYFVEWECLF